MGLWADWGAASVREFNTSLQEGRLPVSYLTTTPHRYRTNITAVMCVWISCVIYYYIITFYRLMHNQPRTRAVCVFLLPVWSWCHVQVVLKRHLACQSELCKWKVNRVPIQTCHTLINCGKSHMRSKSHAPVWGCCGFLVRREARQHRCVLQFLVAPVAPFRDIMKMAHTIVVCVVNVSRSIFWASVN